MHSHMLSAPSHHRSTRQTTMRSRAAIMSKHRSLEPFTAFASLLPIILTIINITGMIDVCRSETVGQETPDGNKTGKTMMGDGSQ